jgi:hypothetical protein
MRRAALTGLAGLAVLAASATVALAGNPQAPGITYSVSSDDSGRQSPVAQCSPNGYSQAVINDTSGDVTVIQFVDKLYSGFTYVPGSATFTDTDTGVTVPAGDPNISANGQQLQFRGPFTIPANDTVTLHFDVVVLDRSDPAVKAPGKGSYPFHGVVSYGDPISGYKVGQNTSIRVSKTQSDCGGGI